jgi:hypothetical protein
MNERIRQLAEQAREYATTRHPVSNIILFVNSDLFEQKFAELLIRECVNIYSKIDNGNLHMGTDNYLEALHKTFRS